MRRLVIVDDVPERGTRWADRLRSVPHLPDEFDIQIMSPSVFSTVVEGLEHRRDSARSVPDPPGHGSWEIDAAANDLDDVDILILDYDLYELGNRGESKAHERVTGEEVAYLARCYSRCKTIVALNQFGENGFDLTLRGHPESFADLNIGSKQLDNPGLWGEPIDGFRPWVWPDLRKEPARHEARLAWLSERLDETVLSGLGLTSVSRPAHSLTREALRFLGPSDPTAVTFASFVRESGEGLDRHDRVWEPAAAARIAAARLGKWLERLVLGGQDALVDAPHLVVRYPSLLPGDESDVASWNGVAKPGVSASEIGMVGPALDEALFQCPDWLSRPAWDWSALVEDRRIDEVRDPWGSPRTELVFCEDVSQVVQVGLSREFTAAISTPFVGRYVVDLDAAELQGAPYFGSFSIRDVDYEPSVQFAL